MTAAAINTDEVATVLASLRNSLQTPRAYEAYLTPHNSNPSPQEQNLPPVDFVVAVVKRIKASPSFVIVCYSFTDPLLLEKLCRKIYFPSEPLPSGSVALLQALVFYIVSDLISAHDPLTEQFDCAAYAELCERNFSSALSTYETLAIPTLENVQVLMFGACRAQEKAKLSLCWTYLAAAHTLCQTMGIHRKSFLQNDPHPVAEAKRHAFWFLYLMEKNLSLNTGRTSSFQDYDIDCELFSISKNPKQAPWDILNLASVGFARIQGKVYDQLYSASAVTQHPTKKASIVEQLATELLQTRDQICSVDISNSYFRDALECLMISTDFMYYSVLTMIYRAQTSTSHATEISSQCYEAARLSLRAHLKTFEHFVPGENHFRTIDFVNWYVFAIFINWIVLYCSFAPYVIVFTHAMATFDEDDITLLRETVNALNQLKEVNSGVRRLFDVCKAFLNTAEVISRSQKKVDGVHRQDDGSLVLSPFSGEAIATGDLAWPGGMADFDMSGMDISAFLGNWLGTNRPVTDMLNLDSDADVLN
ncbi:uncharacterized protein K452DRAFT_148698 [Aplosporella prunicola CBS 121167]|uniref:Xylanolytic transcriptional activator regulatory domain-containing protein n=1 Tax=Aplosporella prunicola CBS 121167 TaxID=1176127 RepID=A0A6A6AY16_9PEZI|nr:uncharacterized protein K452DRAFT_148698 [Aplosporella prunicola CBS 121167]KAF2136053.1 hypothetical protein K452DRAFT_148698 [Aplosporella prunicola CBS 121167]